MRVLSFEIKTLGLNKLEKSPIFIDKNLVLSNIKNSVQIALLYENAVTGTNWW